MVLIGWYPFTYSAAVAEFGKLQSLRALSRVEEAGESDTAPAWQKGAGRYGFPCEDNKC